MKINKKDIINKIQRTVKNNLFILIVVGVVIAASVILYLYTQSTKDVKTYEVVLTDKGFVPQNITVREGDLVRFTTTFKDPFWPASDPHPLHTLYPEFDPKKPISPTSSWTFKAKKVGSWTYHDHLYPAYMGRLTIVNKKNWDIRNKILKRADLLNMVDKDGPQKTYTSLKEIYDATSIYAHSTFHLFGEVLYSKFGLPGIEYCDNFAGFGCYHGLFIKAVSDKGLDVAIDLDKQCVAKFGLTGLGCPHGIGHGLVEYFGLGKINQALSVCSKLSWQGPLFGCSSGVFMENNFPTSFDKDGVGTVSTREAHGNLFEPCLSTPDSFKESCYFEQASWWISILRNDYVKIGKFCTSLSNESQKESCLLGIGNNVAEISGYDESVAKDACSKMPDKNSEAVCRTGASWAFFSNPTQRSMSESLCQGLGQYQNRCLDRRILVK